jgi:hypothetical protein
MCIDYIFIKNVESNKINYYILRFYLTDHFATNLILSDLYTIDKNPSKFLKINIIITSNLN